MIEHFVIFTRGGLVLWTYKFGHIHGSPVDALVRAVLVEVCLPFTVLHHETAEYTDTALL